VELGFLNNERRAKVHIFNTYFMLKMRHLFQERDNDFTKFKQVQQKMEKVSFEFPSFLLIFHSTVDKKIQSFSKRFSPDTCQ